MQYQQIYYIYNKALCDPSGSLTLVLVGPKCMWGPSGCWGLDSKSIMLPFYWTDSPKQSFRFFDFQY